MNTVILLIKDFYYKTKINIKILITGVFLCYFIDNSSIFIKKKF